MINFSFTVILWFFIERPYLMMRLKLKNLFQSNVHISIFEMHKTADFQLNLLVSWELVTEGKADL